MLAGRSKPPSGSKTGDAYENSAYDRAITFLLFGRALQMAGRAADALAGLREAETRLTQLASDGIDLAAQMLAVVAGGLGDALQALGRFNEAAEAQERGIAINEQWGNRRNAAAGRFQLGTIRFSQGQLRDALDAYEQALQTFEALHEPESVASVWHQIGRVHEKAGDWD